jgi:hypothetical protein
MLQFNIQECIPLPICGRSPRMGERADQVLETRSFGTPRL